MSTGGSVHVWPFFLILSMHCYNINTLSGKWLYMSTSRTRIGAPWSHPTYLPKPPSIASQSARFRGHCNRDVTAVPAQGLVHTLANFSLLPGCSVCFVRWLVKPFLAFWLFFLGGLPTLVWPWEGSNYPSWFCNGPNWQKGPKFKKQKTCQANNLCHNNLCHRCWAVV